MAEIAAALAIKAGEQLIGKLAGTMFEKVSKEVSLLLGVRQEVQYIIDELEIMSAFLKDAEEKQASNEAARAWVKQVKQLSYALEDCIDEFSLHLEQRGSKDLKVRYHIAAEIQSIKSRIQEVGNRRLRYGITDTSKALSTGDDYNAARYDYRMASLFMEDSQLVGIDGPGEKLVGWLLDKTELRLSLIAVVGGGGLGKTALARKAYEDPKVTDGHFMCRAWIAVSQVYHIEGLLRDMFKQLAQSPPADLDKIERLQLISKLKDYLKDKRYIIVFDDTWKIDAWKSLVIALPKNDLGSRIILTTRNKEVPEACDAPDQGIMVRTYNHEKLSSERSMELFCKRVFNNPGHICPEDLKKASQDIVDKCDGLPLAIISIAGVLASKPNKTTQEWENLLCRLGSELESNPNLEGIKQLLTLSYNDLPVHVKCCFLYLSKFPENYLIKRKRIQRLWIAEGFVAGHRDMTEEEVAESYFNELVNRFMVLPSEFGTNGKVKRFRVHDIMLELIVSKSMVENIMCVLGKTSSRLPQGILRRLSVHGENNPTNLILSHARSLSMFGDGNPMLISPSLGMLRVLDLDGCNALNDNHLEIVVKLLHLKYLSLQNATGVYKLPKSFGNLRNLESLDVRESNIDQMPASLSKLQQLRVLHGWALNSRFLRVPIGIGSLRALEELGIVNLEESNNAVVKEFRKLTQLKKFVVVCLPKDSSEVFCESLKAISNSLRTLGVHSNFSLSFLNNLSSPPLLLECLTLVGTLGTLPSWVGSLRNVLKIYLQRSELDYNAIKLLGTLPNLMKLDLSNDAFMGYSLFFDAEGFPSLKTLFIDSLSRVRYLLFERGTLPHLETIFFGSPEYTSGTMSISGIRNLPKLKELHIRGLRREDLNEVSTQVAGHPNNPKLIAFRIVESEMQKTILDAIT